MLDRRTEGGTALNNPPTVQLIHRNNTTLPVLAIDDTQSSTIQLHQRGTLLQILLSAGGAELPEAGKNYTMEISSPNKADCLHVQGMAIRVERNELGWEACFDVLSKDPKLHMTLGDFVGVAPPPNTHKNEDVPPVVRHNGVTFVAPWD